MAAIVQFCLDWIARLLIVAGIISFVFTLVLWVLGIAQQRGPAPASAPQPNGYGGWSYYGGWWDICRWCLLVGGILAPATPAIVHLFGLERLGALCR